MRREYVSEILDSIQSLNVNSEEKAKNTEKVLKVKSCA